jgi:hypothetical protein
MTFSASPIWEQQSMAVKEPFKTQPVDQLIV